MADYNVKQTKDGILLKIKIVPNSSKNAIIFEEGFIKVKITAQPIDNKANKALVEYLSKELKVAKSFIEILRGETSKEKTLFINISDDKKREEIISRLTK